MKQEVGSYEVLRVLARGGMAVVYLARQPRLNREVALKRLELESDDPTLVQRFVREAQLAAGLDHPNIVTLFDFFEDDGVAYIAMEYVRGGTLRSLVGRLDLPQVMDALEVGRVNVAARGVGIAQRALELALRYAQERSAFGKPIAQHQAIQFKLADMATKVEAARLLTLKAARMKDAGERSDLEAGMAKLFASEAGKEVVEDSFRIHGGYGYSKEYEIERLYRDAPLLLIGEGTSEIQRMVIGRTLLRRHKI